ncbi:MAG: tRNA lysidine(34) synthetase TilS [Candidatus Acidiferrales bacterium]
MRTPLEQRVLEAIRESRMLEPGDRVGVAVSGGADSVALLRLLESLRGELGITLLAVHFDHALRGDESKADAEFVKELARATELEFVSAREDVAAEAMRNGWNLEDAARRLRYAFFVRVIEEGRATRIAVAHTADDQAETLLAHLMRGTGLTGLAGIYPVVGPMVRPLLGSRREELREYLRARGDGWREDATNRDVRRQRARIRERLLPLIESDFSSSIVGHLGELARLAREEEVFWSALVKNRFAALAHWDRKAVTIRVKDLLSPLGSQLASSNGSGEAGVSLPTRALTERLIRRVYEQLRGDRRELSVRHVELVIRLATESSSGKHVQLAGGIVAERNFGELVFSHATSSKRSAGSTESAAQENAYHYVVSLPNRGAATVSVPELGSRFSLKVIDWPLQARDTKREGEALDADLLRNPLILRNWRPGDAFRPRGRRQARKLKQMFFAGRVPNRDRAGWPVLESDGRVIWARGMAPAADFCVREGTRVGVVIEEDRL